MIVTTVARGPSRSATRRDATTFAPLEEPAKIASSRASRLAIAFASSVATVTISSTSSGFQSGGMKPIPIPSILWDHEGFPDSTADSAGSTATTVISCLWRRNARAVP